MVRKFDSYKRSSKRRAGWLVFAGMILISLSASLLLLREVPEEETVEIIPKNVITKKEPPKPTPKSYTSRMLFTGETFWGRKIAVNSEASELGTAYPFAQLSGFNREDYNAWHTHLECPVTDAEITFRQQADDLIFNCEPEYLPEYAKWFDIASLSNNHTDNVDGESGLIETREKLEAAGIDHYGHFDNSLLDQICEVIPVEFDVVMSDDSSTTTNLPIAFCGFHNVFRVPTEAELDVISDYSKYFITVISPQMGAEYVAEADALKQETYRSMIDRGADLVAASHPHWVQNTEVYKDKLIMYSLGNFMFDQEWSPDVMKGVALDASFSFTHDDNIQLLSELAADCAAFGDTCLTKAQELEIAKPSFEVSYDLVVSEFANSQTFPASEAVIKEMLERTNWETTKQELNDAND